MNIHNSLCSDSYTLFSSFFKFTVTMCPPLMDPENGMVNMTGQDVGDTAFYSCNDGFLLVGSMTTVCQSNGMWSSDPPICLRKQIKFVNE